jgi:hypothetical protein
MKSNKMIARIVGVLFIMGTVSGVLSVITSAEILEAPDLLLEIAANQTQFTISALLILTMGLSLAMVPVMIYPILKKHNEALAVGYVVFRGALEGFTYLAMVVSWLLLIVVSQKYQQTGATDALFLQSLGSILSEANGQIGHVLKIVFPLGALMLNIVLYQSKLVPRWLSVWGLIGVTLHMAEGLLTLFGILPGSAETAMAIPIAIQEMVFAVWLIVKGFNSGVLQTQNNELIGVQLQQ